jgi:hypothetical protein
MTAEPVRAKDVSIEHLHRARCHRTMPDGTTCTWVGEATADRAQAASDREDHLASHRILLNVLDAIHDDSQGTLL